jgi:chloramphenicol 3-O phosphotransferase
MTSGKLILLNGTSCSGKTMIATALQTLLAEPYLTVSIGQFLCVRSTGAAPQGDDGGSATVSAQQVANLHQTILTLANAGHNVIAEHTLLEPAWLRACATQLEVLTPLFVGVRCPLEVVERRAALCGCLQLEQVRTQFAQIHTPGVYDVEVDTSVLSPAECAAQIVHRLNAWPPHALAWLKAYTSPAKQRAWLRLPPAYEGY